MIEKDVFDFVEGDDGDVDGDLGGGLWWGGLLFEVLDAAEYTCIRLMLQKRP